MGNSIEIILYIFIAIFTIGLALLIHEINNAKQLDDDEEV